MEKLGANCTGRFIPLLPVFGALLSVSLLGEHWYRFHLAGADLTAAGTWLASRGQTT